MNTTLLQRLICFVVIAFVVRASAPLRRIRRAAVSVDAKRWPNDVIPYKIDTEFYTPLELSELKFAISTWNNETCVKFRPYRQSDTSWIRITDGGSCWSQYAGFKGDPGEHIVIFDSIGCRYYGLYLHELGHVLGLHHEHVRPDRDSKVKVHFDAIAKDFRREYEKKEEGSLLYYDSIYDLQSVMHYGSAADADNPSKLAMEVKDLKEKPLLRDIYQNVLSFWDAMVVNRHYQCEKKCKKPPRCPKPGFVDQRCRCQTPSSFAKRWCVDRLSTAVCKEMAHFDECYRNVSYAAVNCRKSCGICFIDNITPNQHKTTPKPGIPGCLSYDPTSGCPTSYALCKTMEHFRRCPNVCKNCGVCEDRIDYCATLKAEGDCTLHPESTLFYCRKTCGVCDA